MRLKIVLASLACAWLLFLPACSPRPATFTVTCDDFARQPDIIAVTQTEFAVGRTFTVSLCSDPKILLEWPDSATISNEAVVRQTAHNRRGGQDIYTFRALSPGHCTLSWNTSSDGVDGQLSFRISVNVE